MSDFIEWLAHEAPEWILIMSVALSLIVFMTVLILSLVALETGYWVVPLLVWIVLPAYIVIHAYLTGRSK